jgi:peptidoglycan/LPS O-acetylase OafA/YrhL
MAGERGGAFRPELEGLRGIAILLVVLFHAGVRSVSGAFVAVDVFFVLSGYFITLQLVRELDDTGSVDVSAFYRKRAIRLLPVLLIVLMATLALVMTLYAPIDRPLIASHARAVALYSSNVELARSAVDYFSTQDNPLLHTWSLAVEEQFYLLWPLLFVALVRVFALGGGDEIVAAERRRRLEMALALVGGASFIAALFTLQSSQPWAYFGLPSRVWEFAFGGLIAVRMANVTTENRRANALQAIGLAAIAIPVFVYDRLTPHPGWPTLVPVLGTALLIAAGTSTSALHRALSWRPLQELGRLSYGWYLWHLPLVGVGVALDANIGVPGKLAWSFAALGLAWLTYRFVEQPARAGTLGGMPKAWVMPVAIGASVVAAVIAHLAFGVASRQASAMPQKLFAAAREDRMRHDCWATTLDDPRGACEFGDTKAKTTIALIGDSHAEHWLGALDRAGKERGWKIVAMVKGGCPVADVSLIHPRRKRHYTECGRYREAMVRRTIAMRPDAVILSSWDHYVPVDGRGDSWQVTLDEWRDGLRRTYARFDAAGITTIAFRGTPRTWFDVPLCHSRRSAQLPGAWDCTVARGEAFSVPGRVAQTEAAMGLRVTLLEMNDIVCPGQRCATMRNGIVMYTDDNHLTASFSRSMAPQLGARLAAIVAR